MAPGATRSRDCEQRLEDAGGTAAAMDDTLHHPAARGADLRLVLERCRSARRRPPPLLPLRARDRRRRARRRQRGRRPYVASRASLTCATADTCGRVRASRRPARPRPRSPVGAAYLLPEGLHTSTAASPWLLARVREAGWCEGERGRGLVVVLAPGREARPARAALRRLQRDHCALHPGGVAGGVEGSDRTCRPARAPPPRSRPATLRPFRGTSHHLAAPRRPTAAWHPARSRPRPGRPASATARACARARARCPAPLGHSPPRPHRPEAAPRRLCRHVGQRHRRARLAARVRRPRGRLSRRPPRVRHHRPRVCHHHATCAAAAETARGDALPLAYDPAAIDAFRARRPSPSIQRVLQVTTAAGGYAAS